MKMRTYLAAIVVALVGLTSVPAGASVSITSSHDQSVKLRPCTRTSSGTCIRGGQFCPQASYGHSGWDARGRRYVCKGNHTHPHWMRP
jgi:hypothetical protein